LSHQRRGRQISFELLFSLREGKLIRKMTLAVMTSVVVMALVAASIPAQAKGRVGTPSCDVSARIGLIIFQKQTMTCTFTPDRGGPIGQHLGSIDEYGVALGAVEKGPLI
jgi:hypothetical protein